MVSNSKRSLMITYMRVGLHFNCRERIFQEGRLRWEEENYEQEIRDELTRMEVK